MIYRNEFFSSNDIQNVINDSKAPNVLMEFKDGHEIMFTYNQLKAYYNIFNSVYIGESINHNWCKLTNDNILIVSGKSSMIAAVTSVVKVDITKALNYKSNGNT